jgi:hypothetical protein
LSYLVSLQHQAQRNNMADVSAKDGSQEQVVQLAAMLLGLLLTPYLETHPAYTWAAFAILTALHLYCNYRAVTCVVFNTLNREVCMPRPRPRPWPASHHPGGRLIVWFGSQRAGIVFGHALGTGSVLTPAQTAARERLATWPGML